MKERKESQCLNQSIHMMHGLVPLVYNLNVLDKNPEHLDMDIPPCNSSTFFFGRRLFYGRNPF